MAEEIINELRREIQEMRKDVSDLTRALAVQGERHSYCRDTLVPQLVEDVRALKAEAETARQVQATVARVGNFAVTVIGALCVAGIVGLVVFGLDLFRQFKR